MNDEQRLFEEISRVAASMKTSPDAVCGAAINLLANAIAQTTADRKVAASVLERLIADARKVLLDVHYDPATGLRRTVHPFTQMLRVPFHEEPNDIYPARC